MNPIRRVVLPTRLCSATRLIRLMNTTNSHKSMAALNVQSLKPNQTASRETYLSTLSKTELINYGMIGVATLNKTILDLVIKVFPYVPMFMVRLFIYRLYCGGTTIPEVMETGSRLSERGINNMMLSLTIEGCDQSTGYDTQYIVDQTNESITQIMVPHTVKMIKEHGVNNVPSGYVALKPTGFSPEAASVLRNYKDPEWAGKFDDLVNSCSKVCQVVKDKNHELSLQFPERVAPFVVAVIDAERYELQHGVYELQRILSSRFNSLQEKVSVVGTFQLYLKDSLTLLEKEREVAEKEGYRLGVKLVRGAYIHSEPDRSVIHDTKEATDICYNTGIAQCVQEIISSKGNSSTMGHLVVASHNAQSQYAVTEQLKECQNPQRANVVLGQLLGMADDVTYDLISNRHVNNVIKYVPWGPAKETKEYLQRRLEENGDAVRADNGWPLLKAIFSLMTRKPL